jgi:threonylcarbamoyladenosine tRNA methylthiotransferase MtaB
MAAPELITLGCRLNLAESEAMRTLAADQENLVIINSCAVTNEAVRQTRQAIRKTRRERPDARIIVTGCAAQTDPAMFAAMPEVDQVIGNREKREAASFKRGANDPLRVRDIMAPAGPLAVPMVSRSGTHARAFVEVQTGCDHRCTFCIIPYGRGNSQSVPAGAVIDRIKRLIDEGVNEVVLTGVDVTSYGPDLPGSPSLGQLVERILTHVPELPRLRLSSLDSVEIDPRLFDLLTGEPRVMPHLHLSLQSGDDMILKRMKRRHSRAQAIDVVHRLLAVRRDISIGADIIAGFPTETDAMFDNSLALIEECRIVHGHIFPYSPRKGTPAALMPQVDAAAIKDRAARLRHAAQANRDAWLASLIGTTQSVLVEGKGLTGHAKNFAPVRFTIQKIRGKIVESTISGVEGGALIAQEDGL